MSWLWILVLLQAGIACAISQAKNRPGWEGFFLGALLGVIGIVIVLCLPRQAPRSALPAAGWYPDSGNPGGQRYWNGHRWADLPPALPPMPEPYEPDAELL